MSLMKLVYAFKINWLINQSTDSAFFVPLDASILGLSHSAAALVVPRT